MYDFGTFCLRELSDLPFLVTELLDGRTLEQELARTRVLPPRRAVKILIQLCNSLEEAHRAGIIHGDVKPSNVLLNDVDGEPDFVKLADFSVAGIAPATVTSDRNVGTAAYAPPGMIRG